MVFSMPMCSDSEAMSRHLVEAHITSDEGFNRGRQQFKLLSSQILIFLNDQELLPVGVYLKSVGLQEQLRLWDNVFSSGKKARTCHVLLVIFCFWKFCL